MKRQVNKRRLPLLFWILIGLSVFMVIVLSWGLLLENFPHWPKRLQTYASELFKTRTLGRSAQPTSPTAELPSAAPEKMLPPNEKPPEEPRDILCRDVQSGPLPFRSTEGPKSHYQVLSWSPSNQDQYTLQAYSTNGSLVQLTLGFTKESLPFVQNSTETSILCQTPEQRHCLRVPAGDDSENLTSQVVAHSHRALVVGIQGPQLSRFLAVDIRDASQLKARDLLGYCGQDLDSATLFEILEEDSKIYILALNPLHAVLGVYDFSKLHEFVPRGVPRHPDQSFRIEQEGLVASECPPTSGSTQILQAGLSQNHLLLRLASKNSLRSSVVATAFQNGNFRGSFVPVSENLILKGGVKSLVTSPSHWVLNTGGFLGDGDTFSAFNSIPKKNSSPLFEDQGSPILALGVARSLPNPDSNRILLVNKKQSLLVELKDRRLRTYRFASPIVTRSSSSRSVLLWTDLPNDRILLTWFHDGHKALYYQIVECRGH